MRYTPPAQKFATLRPCLEVLEDRWCPSATATLSPDGHTLVIKGDANANTVSIVQDDANDALVVDCDGTISNFTSSQVTTIRTVLRGGADELKFGLGSHFLFAKALHFDLGVGKDLVEVNCANLGATLDPATIFGDLDCKIIGRGGNDLAFAFFGKTNSSDLNFRAIMGAGNDLVVVGILEDLGGFSHLDFLLEGNAGNDVFHVRAGDQTGTTEDVDVGILSSLSVTMRGHAGRDNLSSYYDGALSGGVSMHLSGGLGADAVPAALAPSMASAPGEKGPTK
jgi:hypothetical protein